MSQAHMMLLVSPIMQYLNQRRAGSSAQPAGASPFAACIASHKHQSVVTESTTPQLVVSGGVFGRRLAVSW
jgi:cytochrome c2